MCSFARQELPLSCRHMSVLLQIMEPTEPIANLDDAYWRLRAEFVPEEELQLQEGERLLHCYHISRVRRRWSWCLEICSAV